MASARVNAYGSLMEDENEMPQQDALEETGRGTEGTSERTVSVVYILFPPSLQPICFFGYTVKSFPRENVAKLQGFNLLRRKV